MAIAKLNTKTESRTEEKRVVTEVKTEVVDSVTLELTLDEARLVRTMVGQASGGGLLRRLSENVFEALDRAGVGSFGREAFDQCPALTTVEKLPRTSYESLPQPKVTREDICGYAPAKPELRVGAKILIVDSVGTSGYRNGGEYTAIRLSCTDGAFFIDEDGDENYAYRSEFEVIG